MSKLTALLASGVLTLFLLGVIGLVAVWNTRASVTVPTPESTALPDAPDAQAAYQASVEELQKAMAERETQYKARLAELEQMAQQREGDYQARLGEAEKQISTYGAQIDQVAQATTASQGQVAQLEQALKERATLFEAKRQEFETQRQERLAQLEAQLSEGKNKLQEANVQLGR